ncbi:hypothetical protein DL766_005339 [Monosporascus sp. MC13-8B]|nr:hypothetical protein DL766_005339 [Monosporascus sp. MC13-8B]
MATNSPKKAILVTGATGKQGGATIDALLNAGALGQHRLLAVTRNPGSGAAKKLEAKGVKVIQGDFRDVPGIFSNAKAALGGTAIGKGASSELEEVQGKALVDAALSNKVKFFVYSSVDRGGERSFDNPTVVPHFISKHNVEHHLVDSARTTDMQWTILRPTALMENFTPDFGTKVTATAWRVAAFMRPGDFAGRAISLAGDELTLSQANAVFKSKVGHEMPETFRFLARLLLWYSAEFGNMFRWFYTDCYGAEIKALKAEHPGLLSLSAWLDQSDWMKKSA